MVFNVDEKAVKLFMTSLPFLLLISFCKEKNIYEFLVKQSYKTH